MKSHTDMAAVLAFWFDDLSPSQWFEADPAVDATCRDQFMALYERLVSGVPAGWLDSAGGCLAAVIVLDQFPRNMFRGDRRAFATDPVAISVVGHAIDKGFDEQLAPARRMFLYMPLQHSEDPEAQVRSVELLAGLGIREALESAIRHKAIIDRFGRFPHRNAILGRPSTDSERAFLQTPGSSF